MGQMLRGNAAAGIFHDQIDPVGMPPQRDPDLSSGGVNFKALEMRFESMRSICTRSTSAGHSGGRSAMRRIWAASAGIWNWSMISRAEVDRSSRALCSATWPDSACDSSKRAHDLRQPLDILQRIEHRFAVLLDVLGGEQRHLELAPDGGDGRAQLVRDVGGKLADLIERAFQALDHAVKSFNQVVQFVAGPREGIRRLRFEPEIRWAAWATCVTGVSARPAMSQPSRQPPNMMTGAAMT